jgi:hypothetical protein
MLPDASNIERMSMVYHTSGNEMITDAHVYMDSAQNAEQLKSTIDLAIQMGEGQMAEQNPELASLLDGLSAEQDGTEVTLSFTTTPDEIIAALEQYANQAMGIAESSMSITPSAVAG